MLAEAAERIRRSLTERLKLQGSYKRVFASIPPNDDADRVLRHLIRTCHVTTSCFVPGDPQQTALNEGKRMVVLSILNQIHIDPEKMTQQIQQAYENTENGRW